MMKGNNTTTYKELVKESLAMQENNVNALKSYIYRNDLGQEPEIQKSLDALTRVRAGLETQAADFDKKPNINNDDLDKINGAIKVVGNTIETVNMIAEGVVSLRSAMQRTINRGPDIEHLQEQQRTLADATKRFDNKRRPSQKPMIQRVLDTISKVFNQVVSAIKGLFQKAELPNPRAGGAGDHPGSAEFERGGASATNKEPSVNGRPERDSTNTARMGGP